MDLPILALKGSLKYVELVTAIFGSIYYYKFKHTYLKYVIVILWYTVINEFLGFYLRLQGYDTNMIIYNIYHLINFVFLETVYYTYVKNKTHKQWIRVFIIIYVLSFFINMFFQNYFFEAQTIPFILGASFIIISILFYFSEILNTEKIINVYRNLLFWISIGLFLYHIGKIPTRILRNFYIDSISNFEYFYLVEYMLSVIMNLFFIIGFIWSKKEKQF